jgi:hypothetical protein
VTSIYQPPKVEVDRDAIFQEIVTDLETAIPGLEVAPGTLLWVLVRAVAARHAEELELLVERAEGEYDAFGQKLIRLPREAATQASTTSTWTATDTAGHTIDAGTQITLDDGAGNRVAFAVQNTVTIPGGSNSTATGAVTLVAVEAGSAATGLSLDPQPERTLSWLASITIVAPTTGGQDAEDEDTYVDRLADELTLLQRTLTTTDKFEAFARNQPGVDRALAIARYDADTGTSNVGGHVTTAIIDENGLDPGSSVRTAVQTAMSALVVAGVAAHVIAATYNAITVVFAAKAEAGYDTTDVHDRAVAAVKDFLSPANWGRPRSGDRPLWVDTPKVRFQDVSTVLNQVEGLDYWTSLTINGGTSDVTMTGVAALPAPTPTSSVSGTVT